MIIELSMKLQHPKEPHVVFLVSDQCEFYLAGYFNRYTSTTKANGNYPVHSLNITHNKCLIFLNFIKLIKTF